MNKKNKNVQEKQVLSSLVNMENPQSIISEVKVIISMEIPEFDFSPLYQVFYDIVRLFQGDYPGYRKCNTDYHDLNHTTNIFLTLARLIHGYLIKKKRLSEKKIRLGLISALMHDTGYIQNIDDNYGTGAKYTLEHITRSILFMDKYFSKNNYSQDDFTFCKTCINCTGKNKIINQINFHSHEEEIIGKMLGTADILGQMADRIYLEKLLFLYYEFREGNVNGYENELDILKKTLEFYQFITERFAYELGNQKKYMIHHFIKRWNINTDLYEEAIENNIGYLKFILDKHRKSYRNYLRRGNVVNKLREKDHYFNA